MNRIAFFNLKQFMIVLVSDIDACNSKIDNTAVSTLIT